MLDHLYRQAMRVRRAWYGRRGGVRQRLSRPVISVGNLSVGGTGKTPLVAALAARLVAMGERPAILSRGYGRRRVTTGPLVVSDGRRVLASVDESGDEPMLLARLVPEAIVIVGASRYASGRLAEQTLSATFHVLDDGFQHVRLARDLDVLMTTPGEIVGERVLPLGRLREGVEAATHADVLVVAGATASEAAAEGQSLGIAQSCGAMRVLDAAEWVGPQPDPPVDLACLLAEHAPVVAVAGVAHPSRFFEGLESQGWVVTRRIPLADHHWFTARDVTRIAAAADESGARIVMATEKDVVKLERLMPLPFPLASVPMRLHVEPASALDRWIADARDGHQSLSHGEGL